MSIRFDKEIFSNGSLTLKINFSGIKDSVTTTEELKMSVYAFDSSNGQPKFSEVLSFEEIKSLYAHLTQISIIRDSSLSSSGKFVETTDAILDLLEALKDIDKSLLKTVLNKLRGKEKIGELLSAFSEVVDDKGVPIMDNIVAFEKFKLWQSEIENLKILLGLEENGNIVELIKNETNLSRYEAGQPEKIFQKWIEFNHLWIFGVEYIRKHDFRRIGLNSEGDILMESMDGFLDLIELKRPKFEIFKFDDSHNSYYPSIELSKVIGQCLLYLQEMEDIKLKLESKHKVKILRPRVKIIAGRTKGFNKEQYDALRMLNCNLNNIQIISYDYLLSCGDKMIANYK